MTVSTWQEIGGARFEEQEYTADMLQNLSYLTAVLGRLL